MTPRRGEAAPTGIDAVDRRTRVLGGGLSVAVGVCLVALLAVAWRETALDGADILRSLLLAPERFPVARGLLAIAALLGVGVVPAVEAGLERFHAGLIRWLGQLATLSFFVAALAHAQAGTGEVMYFRIDPHGWLWIGCLATWVGGSSLVAGRHRAWPLPVVLLGGLLSVCLGASLVFQVVWSLAAASVATSVALLVLAPSWFLALGLHLLRSERASISEDRIG